MPSCTFQRWLREILFEFSEFLDRKIDIGDKSDADSCYDDDNYRGYYARKRFLQNVKKDMKKYSPTSTVNEDDDDDDDDDSDDVGYDEAVRYVLRPLWFAIRSSVHLELSIAVSLLVIEVLHRSYILTLLVQTPILSYIHTYILPSCMHVYIYIYICI